jgi:TRAP-type C4-dicarboxylate transport system permease small subunit
VLGDGRAMKVLRRVADAETNALEAISTVGAVVLFSLTVADVTLRYVFGSGIPGALEIIELTLVVLVIGSLASAERAGVNIRAQLLTSQLPARASAWVRVAGRVITVLFVGLLLYSTIVVAMESTISQEARFGLLHLWIWPVRIFIPIAVLALLLVSVIQLFEQWKVATGPAAEVDRDPLALDGTEEADRA